MNNPLKSEYQRLIDELAESERINAIKQMVANYDVTGDFYDNGFFRLSTFQFFKSSFHESKKFICLLNELSRNDSSLYVDYLNDQIMNTFLLGTYKDEYDYESVLERAKEQIYGKVIEYFY